ncbi:hypothetical protein BJ170DRAFT_414041 [Xylariales sp. AK1849]|nr:hypothetical protein BJ170DRAFT_414041 [Xylariales sp. AK1849]
MSTTYILDSMNGSRRSTFVDMPTQQLSGLQTTFPSNSNFLYPLITWSTLWFSLLCVFVALNIKSMPFMWHMRILNAFRFTLRTQRPSVPLTSSHIFQPIITTSSAQLMEIDFNMHKSNSSYFADVDIARTHLVCTLFAKGIAHMRGGTAAYTGSKQPVFGLALGAVSCNFKRELRPYEQYEMWSKILSWDEKWIYIVTHFVRKDAAKPRTYSLYPEQTPQGSRGSSARSSRRNSAEGLDDESLRRVSVDGSYTDSECDFKPEKQLFATALSKCVFKSGRKTVAPDLMLQMSGLLPTPAGDGEDGFKSAITLQDIEEQRQRGFKIAQQLAMQNQQNLEAEFAGDDCEALGRHTDGAGIVGVVNTLMQLAHIKKGQVL